MMTPRFFCGIPLVAGQAVTLPAPVAHHADRVLRLRSGDEVVLFNGRGGEYAGRIEGPSRVGRVRLDAWRPIEREPQLAITLGQALPATEKMEWIVQKAVELGVTEIAPIVTARSIVRLSGERASKRIAHLQQIAVAACEQCGRNTVPAVRELRALPDFLGQPGEGPSTRLVLEPAAGVRVAMISQPLPRVILLVGPEGGLTEEELDAARSMGFVALALGPRMLRTETAGLAAAVALLSRWGDI